MLIAQITDTHIVEKNNHWLFEPSTKTDERLIKVVSYLNELKNKPDVVLLTGDACDTTTKESYSHLKELLSPLNIPLYVVPGNHDCRETMREAFLNSHYMPTDGFIHYTIDDYPIRLIALDTHEPNEAFGRICEERFVWLKETLHQDREKPTLIFMHHPPSITGTRVFDAIKCQVPSDFEKLISVQNNLLGIITGHYHHFCSSSYGGKSCFIAPSVAPNHYFANPQKDTEVTALELTDPAITFHKWHSTNAITSHIVYLKDRYNRIDWKSILNNKTN